MRCTLVVLAGFLLTFSAAPAGASASDELSLFDGSGSASAYIALRDGLTIYLWSGTPVAYLIDAGRGRFDVFGFNGKHLGCFERGALWDHDGNGACALKEMIGTTELEPLKSFKELKPLKSLKELAPIHPLLTGKFGGMRCDMLLAEGAE